MSITLAELARELGLEHQGEGSRGLSRVSGWDDAGPDSLIYCDLPSKAEALPEELPAGALLAPREAVRPGWRAVFSAQAKLDFARAARLISPPPVGAGSQHSTAVVSPSARIGDRVDVGPYVTVEAHVVVGEGTILHPGVVVGAGSRGGAGSVDRGL